MTVYLQFTPPEYSRRALVYLGRWQAMVLTLGPATRCDIDARPLVLAVNREQHRIRAFRTVAPTPRADELSESECSPLDMYVRTIIYLLPHSPVAHAQAWHVDYDRGTFHEAKARYRDAVLASLLAKTQYRNVPISIAALRYALEDNNYDIDRTIEDLRQRLHNADSDAILRCTTML